MLTVTRWSPDTCACVIEYEWDTETTEDNRIHKFHRVEKCSEHSGVVEDNHVFLHVLKENRSAMAAFAALHRIPRLVRQVTMADGSPGLELKPGIASVRTFSGKDHQRRVRHKINGVTLTPAEKLQVAQHMKDHLTAVLHKDLSAEDQAIMQTLADPASPPIDLI